MQNLRKYQDHMMLGKSTLRVWFLWGCEINQRNNNCSKVITSHFYTMFMSGIKRFVIKKKVTKCFFFLLFYVILFVHFFGHLNSFIAMTWVWFGLHRTNLAVYSLYQVFKQPEKLNRFHFFYLLGGFCSNFPVITCTHEFTILGYIWMHLI